MKDRCERKGVWKKALALAFAAGMIITLAGCSMLSEERVKLEDLGFTVVSEEKVPEELKNIIEEKKAAPFKLTYSDKEYLYIVIGYGQQTTGGYSIAVNELYLTDSAIYVNTSLLGPESGDAGQKTPSYPYIVLKLDNREEPVIFE